MRYYIQSLHIQREDNKFFNIFLNIEMKILPIFAMMEYVGIGFNEKVSESGKHLIQRKIEYLDYKAHVLLPGKTFSLSSGDNVSEILFTDLKIPPPEIAKSTSRKNRLKKQYYLTNSVVLEQINHYHPLPSIISEYRVLTHHISHYIDVLGKYLFRSDHYQMDRIYSTIQQTIVPTGRIAMENPNLQNISHPIDFKRAPEIDFSQESIKSFNESLDRFEYLSDEHYLSLLQMDKSCDVITVSIRNAFIPANGCKLLSVDYGQLELRILTHLSQDPKLMEMFNCNINIDIFKYVAHQVGNIPYDSVTDSDRQQAKHLVYGILYGMGIKSIASELHIPIEQARGKLENFKKTYNKLIEYLEMVEENVIQNGYIATLFGRVRNFSNIHSCKIDNNEISKVKRAARNSIPQGTAADIAKMAMIKIQDELDKNHFKAQMILQLHDEILFEVPENELYQSAQIIKYSMENVVKLSVSLPIKMSIGPNWGSLKPFEV
ncbi:hypothetical protein DICPUDRAFT_34531 [Dictyostelium purpureum]|uniref:DNA-directed DNA polymerase n=1 Tax=Dictyostelium purpureum TaxID=5786 RepID=F0ZMW2_DICPU|nr:uncharacterized protein DICPUDRAFT_34531 [Dictyostelium purpureum]EGC34721.1 hypothetical protein DICPUDRAFT_34531 [Dictyostelium purpureum]|eukprot:XP_003288762.1 hypothetical protein DICPUDRAFT_34531 [Dictyostelium purpureum]